MAEDCACLAKDSSLTAEFVIPNAAAKVVMSADVLRKVLNISMKLEAPKDKSRATASMNWLTRQFKGLDYKEKTLLLTFRSSIMMQDRCSPSG